MLITQAPPAARRGPGHPGECRQRQRLQRPPGVWTTARETSRAAAKLLNIPERLVLPSSTGVIGAPLPGDRITQALPQLVAGLHPDGLGEVARAIMTTDTRPKASLVKGRLAARNSPWPASPKARA